MALAYRNTIWILVGYNYHKSFVGLTQRDRQAFKLTPRTHLESPINLIFMSVGGTEEHRENRQTSHRMAPADVQSQ